MAELPTLEGDKVFSPIDLLKFAQLCNATYAPADNKTIVESIGMQYVLDIKDESCPVTIATWGDYKICAFQGTSVGKNLNVLEILADLDNSIVTIDDMRIHRGFWAPMANVMTQVLTTMDGLPGKTLITGHSLGGVRAHLAKAFFPGAQVVSYGAPKGATDAFWKKYYPDYPPTRVVHEHDFAPGWPYDGPWTQPAKLTWIHNNTISLVEDRGPELQISLPDHSILNGYIAALTIIVATGVATSPV